MAVTINNRDTGGSQPSLKETDLYELIDAIGFPVNLQALGGNVYTLEGEAESTLRLGELKMKVFPQIVDSHLDMHVVGSTAVVVDLIGDLQLLFLHSHNHNRLELLVIDSSKGTPKFEKQWSRLKTMFSLRECLVAHYLWAVETLGDTEWAWVETPNANRWNRNYLTLREVNKLDSTQALELADMDAFGVFSVGNDMDSRAAAATKFKKMTKDYKLQLWREGPEPAPDTVH